MGPEQPAAPQEPAQMPPQQATDALPATAPQPAIGQVLKKPKKKRKYSKGLKDLQQLQRTVSRTSTRVARAVAKGMATYRKRSNKSARKKRDGAIRDFGINFAEGLGKTMRVLSAVPSDLAAGLNTKRTRKRMRRGLRAASRLTRPLGY